MTDMTQLICEYKKSLMNVVCDDIIDLFDETQTKLVIKKNNLRNCIILNSDSTIQKLSSSDKQLLNIEKSIYKELLTKIYNYRNHLLSNNITHEILGFLSFKLMTSKFTVYKFNSGETLNPNERINNRYIALSYILFLNNVDNGGTIKFNDIEIKPEVGKLILFPDSLEYKFKHNCPVDCEQYFIYGNILYLENK